MRSSNSISPGFQNRMIIDEKNMNFIPSIFKKENSSKNFKSGRKMVIGFLLLQTIVMILYIIAFSIFNMYI